MKRKGLLLLFLLTLLAEAAGLIWFTKQDTEADQDPVKVNELLWSIRNEWDTLDSHVNTSAYTYTVLDETGRPRYTDDETMAQSINEAIIHHDTVLDVVIDDVCVGKLIIHNPIQAEYEAHKQQILIVFLLSMLIQCLLAISYICYLQRTIIEPFHKLHAFARRVADGNLDIPLTMDRKNIFGAFSEAFDIMRQELHKARIAEAKANESKKELVAKLSHDMKTPLASIKAAAEVGATISVQPKIQENYRQIILKTDQITALLNNLFTSTLEELQQLTITPADMESSELIAILKNADYCQRSTIPQIPSCIIYADKLRLQQVFDNIFVNSYKYANTAITIRAKLSAQYLCIEIEDYGGGAAKEELPYLKAKYKRGKQAEGIEGAGLGLYIADCFMQEMGGTLSIENGKDGFQVIVSIALSGTI